MEASHRILRSQAQEFDPVCRDLTSREIARRDRVLATATHLLACHPTGAITFRGLATAMSMAPTTLRRLFVDMDALLGEILQRHLLAVSNALGKVSRSAPGGLARCRAAYIDATRRPFGGPTEAHLLLLRNRHSLPDDLYESIEQMRLGLGDLLAYGHATEVLLLLDCPMLDPLRVEAMLEACQALGPPRIAAPQPETADRADCADAADVADTADATGTAEVADDHADAVSQAPAPWEHATQAPPAPDPEPDPEPDPWPAPSAAAPPALAALSRKAPPAPPNGLPDHHTARPFKLEARPGDITILPTAALNPVQHATARPP